MLNEKWLNLQLFADGAGGSGASAGTGTGSGAASGGEGNTAATGENATAAAEQRLRELGVPEDKIRKRASKVASRMPQRVAQAAPATQKANEPNEQTAPANDSPTEESKTETKRMSWAEIMADPEYNKEMQATVQARLKNSKKAEDALTKLTPALELLARKHKLDPANMDYDALAKAIGDDHSYYEEKALEMGVPVETAMKIDQQERKDARDKIRADRTLREQAYAQHMEKLESQGRELKKIFPSFDLRHELQNPAFRRMTAPGNGIMSVEDAYRAVHRKEIDSAAMQVVAQKTAQKISNAIQSGSRRPDEAGTQSQAPSVTTFNYRNASKEEREALKQRIRSAAARGEKLYPGQ